LTAVPRCGKLLHHRKSKGEKMEKYLSISGPVIGGKRRVSFVPAKDLLCEPPYLAGKLDGCWANVKGVNPRNKTQCEKAVGMELLPLPVGE
jgi:hypothetical protein